MSGTKAPKKKRPNNTSTIIKHGPVHAHTDGETNAETLPAAAHSFDPRLGLSLIGTAREVDGALGRESVRETETRQPTYQPSPKLTHQLYLEISRAAQSEPPSGASRRPAAVRKYTGCN
ncbi:hypothetical protein GWI33_004264 [Rhynchophorus ferrugineus]|uniref:Uncharacterized protein n=1 Tax=Rhynchophorus ferrugineus TaxID=354439 RepID=A0A834ILR5_RHYFE|nr:hypothetical protein GWI33_004264 [Rhynchophorus ferrugineus]